MHRYRAGLSALLNFLFSKSPCFVHAGNSDILETNICSVLEDLYTVGSALCTVLCTTGSVVLYCGFVAGTVRGVENENLAYRVNIVSL